MNKTELEALYLSLLTYPHLEEKAISLINALIIFGNGAISEYSFIDIFKNKYNYSFSHEVILDYLRYFDSIYTYSEEEDVEIGTKFIWYKDEQFLSYLKIRLASEIFEVRDLYLMMTSNVKFEGEHNIYLDLRSRAILLNSPDIVFYYLSQVKPYYYRDHDVDIVIKEIYNEDTTFIKRLSKVINQISNEDQAYHITYFYLYHLFPLLDELEDHISRQLLAYNLYKKINIHHYLLDEANNTYHDLYIILKGINLDYGSLVK